MDSDFETDCSILNATPHHDRGRVPPGAIVCNPRWKATDLASVMKGKLRIVFEDDNDIVDFHPAHDKAVVYVTEGDLIGGSAYRKKLAKLRKAKKMKGIVLVDKTPMMEQYFLDVQKFVVLELGFVLIPVTNQTEAGNLLIQMVNEENKPHANPFVLRGRRNTPMDQAVLATVQTIPTLGSVKAKALLTKFKSIRGIQSASLSELSSVIGKGNAHHVRKFFDEERKVR